MTDDDPSCHDLREMVFNLNHANIGIPREHFGDFVWGMLMETAAPEGAFSLISFVDGTTSLYFSKTGEDIGSGEEEAVAHASKTFLMKAQDRYKSAAPATEYPGPKEGEVKFYFLTHEGVRVYTAPEERLGNENDEFSELFFTGHDVIEEIRKLSGND